MLEELELDDDDLRHSWNPLKIYCSSRAVYKTSSMKKKKKKQEISE